MSSNDDNLADAFLTASRVLVGLVVHSLGASPVDVTFVQHRLLVLVAAHGERTVGELAEELGVNPSNATRHCDRLQRLGLIERRRSAADGRVVQVVLTQEGRDVVAAVSRARHREVSRVLEGMRQEDRATMLGALEAFSDAAQERADRDWATNVW